MMVASLLETIFVTNLMKGSAHYDPAPRWIRMLFLHVLGPLVRLPPKPKQQEDIVIQNPDAQGKIQNKDVILVQLAVFICFLNVI